jgi:hypothetical protein
MLETFYIIIVNKCKKVYEHRKTSNFQRIKSSFDSQIHRNQAFILNEQHGLTKTFLWSFVWGIKLIHIEVNTADGVIFTSFLQRSFYKTFFKVILVNIS